MISVVVGLEHHFILLPLHNFCSLSITVSPITFGDSSSLKFRVLRVLKSEKLEKNASKDLSEFVSETSAEDRLSFSLEVSEHFEETGTFK